MEQTFQDLYKEQEEQTGDGLFLLSIFTETAIGIVREYLLLMKEGDSMKIMLANPRSAAIISLLLSLPLGLTFAVYMFDIEPLVRLLNNLFTVDGQQGEINMLGRIVIFGGLLLLPVALALNLQLMLKREVPERIRRLYAINLVGAAILLLIILTWGGLILEETYCIQGIRCE